MQYGREPGGNIKTLIAAAVGFVAILSVGAAVVASPAGDSLGFAIDSAQASQVAVRRIKYAPTCSGCKIELTRIVTLDSSPRVPDLGGPPMMERDSKGRFFTTDYDRSQVLVFSGDGKFLTAFGRRGDGPGEFGTSIGGVQGIRMGRGDTIWVHSSPSRVSVFSPDLRFVRSMDVRGSRFAFITLPTGDLLAMAEISTPGQVGHPLHVLSPMGAIRRSFGDPGMPLIAGARPSSWHQFALTHDNATVWVTNERYMMRHMSMEGRVLHDFQITDVPWLSSQVPARGSQPLTGPTASVRLGGVDATGLLWFNANIPNVGGDIPYARRIEVFDPVKAELLVSQAHPYTVYLISGSNLGYSLITNTDGLVRITIWRVALLRPK